MDEPSGGATPELSIVLSSLGNYSVLARVLEGYERQDAPPGSFELIVVIDRADPDLAAADEAIGRRPYPVRRLIGRRPGLSANRNTGWREARAPLVLITDNDTIPVPRLVSEHLEWHRRFPQDEVAVAGHVRWALELELTPFMKWLDKGFQFDFGSTSGIDGGWAHLYGANSSMKRAFIQRVGDWDEENLPYLYDDLDWAYRAHGHGLRVVYNRDAIVDHYRTDGTLEFWKQKMPRIARAEYAFVRKHPELKPWFHRVFTKAAGREPHGSGVPLTRFIPEDVPWLGPRVWKSADHYWKRQLAPYFLEAWAECEAADASKPSGSMPSGPK
jgi:GT2 family glycosyltransferase